MKVFIVFAGLLIINMGFIAYQGDMSSYQQLQRELKAVAEESAAGAALYYDEQAFGQGRMVIRDSEAVSYVDYMVNKAEEKLSQRKTVHLSYQLHIIDEKQDDSFRSYRDGIGITVSDSNLPDSVKRVNGSGHVILEPSTVVDLTADTDDLFRLPFLEVKQIKRSAMYELWGANR